MNLSFSDYVTIVVLVPETHADKMRQVLGEAGAGKTSHYSFSSFSVKGITRFKPEKGSVPYIGEEGKFEEVSEERIEVICAKDSLENIIEIIKAAHPYEETIIDIYPIYTIGCKGKALG